MRAVILLNPHISAEHGVKGRGYAQASIGFDYDGAIDDNVALAQRLRKVADMLEAKPIVDPDLT